MSRLWKYAYPCYLFCAPMSVIGFVIASVFYQARDWQMRDGVLTCIAGQFDNGVTRIWGRPNAQTLGWVQIYDNVENRDYPDLRVHENVHIVQAFVGGLVGAVLGVGVFAIAGWPLLCGALFGGLAGGAGFSVTYGVLFLYHWVKQGFGDWYFAYRANPFEVQAYKRQDEYIANQKSLPEDRKTRPWGV